MVQGMNELERADAVYKLAVLREMLASLGESFDQVVEMADAEQATGLAFSAKMLQESIKSFQSELSRFVLKRIAEE